jgi:glycosyltransferase involved in cell wall biosynthesis
MASVKRVGIWCDYGFTFKPEGGTGVFIYSLLDALVNLPGGPQVTLQICPKDRDQIEPHLTRYGDRLRVWPPTPSVIEPPTSERREPAAVAESVVSEPPAGTVGRLRRMVGGTLRSMISPTAVEWLRSRIDGTPMRPVPGFPAGPTGSDAVSTPAAASNASLAGNAIEDPNAPIAPGVDVWLLPYPGTGVDLPTPQVLVVFDMVYKLVKGVCSEENQRNFDRVLEHRIAQASLVYCSTAFVRDEEILPLLPHTRSRLRMFPLAPPEDIGGAESALSRDDLKARHGIDGPFLFYPAVLFQHKNHANLVRAFAEVAHEEAFADASLVLTGTGPLEPEVKRLAAELGIGERLKFLGFVSRETLAGLFRSAMLVPLATVHEGYGIPLLEAIRAGSLTVCSDVPAFRELLGSCVGDVPMFDPEDPRAMASAMREAVGQRNHWLARHAHAWTEISRRSWRHVAKDFVELFEEAARLGMPKAEPGASRRAA